MSIINLTPGEVVRCKDADFELMSPVNEKSILATRLSTGQKEILEVSEIQPVDADLTRHPDLVKIPPAAWQIAKDRFKAIRPLLRSGRNAHAAYLTQAEVANVHPATLYRWKTKFLKTGLIAALLPERKGPKMGRTKLDSAVETIISTTVKECYLTDQKRSPSAVFEEIRFRCRNAQIAIPHYNTVRKRIALITDYEKLRRREGTKAADHLYTPNEGNLFAGFPLAVVQMDHTLLDIVAVDDESRMPIGRPWITVCFDVYSRMVVGFYVSLDPPGALSAGLGLSRSILRKDTWLLRLGVDLDWPCWGLPASLHMDNAKEFRGEMLQRACEQYGIDVEWRPVAKPNWGGHIERYMLNFSNELKTLPGATFSNPTERGDYDSDGRAAMTIMEIEKYLVTFICGKYHQQIHSTLGKSPLAAWREGIFGNKSQPGRGLPRLAADEERLRLDFMPFEHRTINEYGVLIDGIHYFADVLRPYINSRLPGKYKIRRKFIFRRDPRDVSQIYFFDEDNSAYHVIPYRNTARPPISLWELNAAKRYLKGRHESTEDEGAIFQAIGALRGLVHTSVKETKRVRRERQRRKMHTGVHETGVAALSSNLDDGREHDGDTATIKPFDELELT